MLGRVLLVVWYCTRVASCCLVLSRVVLMLCRVVSCCTRVMLRCLSCCYSCSFLDLIYNLIVHNPFINYLKLIIDSIQNLLSGLKGVGEGKAKMSCYRT